MNIIETDGNTQVIRRGAVDTPPPVRGREVTAGAPARGVVKYVAVAVLVLLVGAGGFAAGFGLGKGTGVTAANGLGANGTGRGFGQRMNGGFGTVTSVSDTSITIEETRPGGMSATGSAATTKTYAITDSTTITDNGTDASASDIGVGDTVLIRTASSSSTDATSITLNPSIGGAPGTTDGTSSTTGTGTASPSTT